MSASGCAGESRNLVPAMSSSPAAHDFSVLRSPRPGRFEAALVDALQALQIRRAVRPVDLGTYLRPA